MQVFGCKKNRHVLLLVCQPCALTLGLRRCLSLTAACRCLLPSQLELLEQFGLQLDSVGGVGEVAAADQKGVLDTFAQRRDLCCV